MQKTTGDGDQCDNGHPMNKTSLDFACQYFPNSSRLAVIDLCRPFPVLHIVRCFDMIDTQILSDSMFRVARSHSSFAPSHNCFKDSAFTKLRSVIAWPCLFRFQSHFRFAGEEFLIRTNIWATLLLYKGYIGRRPAGPQNSLSTSK